MASKNLQFYNDWKQSVRKYYIIFLFQCCKRRYKRHKLQKVLTIFITINLLHYIHLYMSVSGQMWYVMIFIYSYEMFYELHFILYDRYYFLNGLHYFCILKIQFYLIFKLFFGTYTLKNQTIFTGIGKMIIHIGKHSKLQK